MSFKEKFPKVAAFFASLTDGGNEVVASEDFSKVELTQKQFEAIEAEMNDLGTKAENTETALTAANNELAEVKAANAALNTEKETLTAQVAALTADVAAKDEKLAEYKNIAAGGGHTKAKSDGSAEEVDVKDAKLNYSAENVELG
jgi:septal ring factor EnvC (AmiA/AmiB activator)